MLATLRKGVPRLGHYEGSTPSHTHMVILNYNTTADCLLVSGDLSCRAQGYRNKSFTRLFKASGLPRLTRTGRESPSFEQSPADTQLKRKDRQVVVTGADAVTVKEAAKIAGVHPKTVYRAIDCGDLPCFRYHLFRYHLTRNYAFG